MLGQLDNAKPQACSAGSAAHLLGCQCHDSKCCIVQAAESLGATPCLTSSSPEHLKCTAAKRRVFMMSMSCTAALSAPSCAHTQGLSSLSLKDDTAFENRAAFWSRNLPSVSSSLWARASAPSSRIGRVSTIGSAFLWQPGGRRRDAAKTRKKRVAPSRPAGNSFTASLKPWQSRVPKCT